MYCKKCGAEMEDGARFCPSCGGANEESVPEHTENMMTPKQLKKLNRSSNPDNVETAGRKTGRLSMIFGLIGLVLHYFGIPAFILSLISRSQNHNHFSKYAKIGFITGIIDYIIGILSIVLYLVYGTNPFIIWLTWL